MAGNNANESDPLQELLLWVKAAVIPDVKARVDRTLSSTEQRRAYNAADGTKTGKELAAIANKSAAAMSGWSKRWRQLGIASLTADGQLKHLQSLEAFGLAVETDTDED
jgi:hypothetical protein